MHVSVRRKGILMRRLISVSKGFLSDESGATMVEYALMVALVAVVAIAGVTTLGTAISGQFTSVAGSI